MDACSVLLLSGICCTTIVPDTSVVHPNYT